MFPFGHETSGGTVCVSGMRRAHHDRPKLGQLHIPHWLLHALEGTAIAIAMITVVFLALDSRFSWLKHSPGGQAFDVGAQPWFMVAFAAGALLALRFRLLGGALAAFTAAGLIVFTNRQLRLADSLIVFAGFLVPGLLWITVGLFELRDEKFHRTDQEHPRPLLRRRDVLGGILGLALAGIGGTTVARRLFDSIYGPTHPGSTVAKVGSSLTRWVWSGAVSTDRASVTTRLTDDDEPVASLLLWQDGDRDGAIEIPGSVADEGFVRVELTSLEPATDYRYAFRVGDRVDENRVGRFRTIPRSATSFAIAFGSCARTGSNGAVFDAIVASDPAMVIIDGDWHYADIAQDSEEAFRGVLDYTLSRPAQAAMLQSCPVAYVWDDHDYGGTSASSLSRPAAMSAYRNYAPHYPLASATSSIYQAFSIGRVRFVLTDTRSSRTEADDDDGGTATMLGNEQLEWLKGELLDARRDHVLTVWVNPVPWISVRSDEGDDWSAHSRERTELADHIADNELGSNLLMLSGDAHMTAIDDGTNSDYSTSGQGGFPVFHAGALDRPGRVKGGPYSHGTFPGGGQFGHVSFADLGESMRVQLSGRNWRNEEFVGLSFDVR